MKTVKITDQILSGNLSNLWSGSDYDEYASALRLAELLKDEYRNRAKADYPDAKIIIEIDVQQATGSSAPMEIVVTDSEDPFFVEFPDTEWYSDQFERINFDDWAVA